MQRVKMPYSIIRMKQVSGIPAKKVSNIKDKWIKTIKE